MISQTVEYALRAVVALAQYHPESRTATQLAEETQVPSMYLSKIMQGLVRADVINSQRGPGGGFTLINVPQEISVWDIIEAVEPFKRIRTCPLKLSSHGTNLCPLHRRLDDTMAAAEKTFRKSCIADLLGGKGVVTPLCDAQE